MRDLTGSNLTTKEINILKELDINARQSSSAIGKKLRISKQVINYHIDSLVKKGLIKEFITYIDTQKIGYTFYNILIKLKYMTTQEKEKIVNRLSAIPGVVWLSSFRGEWQMIISILERDVGNFSVSLDEVLNSLKGKLLDYNFFIVISASQLGYKKIYSETIGEYNYHAKIGHKGEFNFSANDFKVLKVIANDARLPMIEIARKTKLTLEKVRYSLKKLEKDKLIQGYRPLLDVAKLGYLWNVMFLRLKSSSEEQRKDMADYLKSLPEVFYVVRGVGNCNLMVEFQTKTSDEFEKVKELISKQFSNLIADEKTVQLTEEHKCTYFPGSLEVNL